jgi:hypothetical protein
VKYTPLNLSFLQTYGQQPNIANTARSIMANAGFSQPSQVTLQQIAEAQKKAQHDFNSAHKQTFLSSVFDMLQTPLYGLANALDQGLAAHQSDSNDSVITDISKTLQGGVEGFAKGIAAGNRGATGIADLLPGVDINDEWQSNPANKTHFSDVAIRKETGLSTADAINPENWAKIKPKLEAAQKKGLFDKTFFELFIPDNLDSPDAQQNYLRNTMLAGIPSDIGADPLNFATGGGAGAAGAAKGITEGLEAARGAKGVNQAILAGLDSKAMKNAEEFKGALNAPAPVTGIADVTPEAAAAATKAALPSISHIAPKGADFKTLATMGRREDIPVQGLEIPVSAPAGATSQLGLAKKILTWAGSGDKTWAYRAADLLRNASSKVEWTKTEALIQKADKVIKKLGPRGANGLAPVLRKYIAEDVEAARNAVTRGDGAERRLLNTTTDVSIRQGAPKLKVAEARIANRAIRKFENEILGKGRPSGTGEGLANAIASGDNVRYSGPQQARIWNYITSQLKYAEDTKFAKATRISRAVEDYFITKGAIPHSAAAVVPKHGLPGSVPLRLSEVANAIGPAQFGRRQELFQQAAKTAAQTAAAAGSGETGAHVAKAFTNNLLGHDDVINSALRANRLKTEAWLGKVGKTGNGIVNDPNFVKSVTTAIVKASGLPSPKSLSGAVGAAARVADWFGARFNASYGIQDMSPMLIKSQASAMATTARRAKVINDLASRFPPSDVDLWNEAFRTAQQNGISDGRVAELQSEIAKTMENLFGGTGLRDGAISDGTVVGRNRLLMDELNRNLKRFGLSSYKFENGKKVVDAAGVTHDLSNGIDWLKSWETWKVTRPYEFLHKIQNVVEYTVREKNLFDDMISRFASDTKAGDFKYGVNHPRLKGFYFNQEGARQAQQVVSILEQISTPSSKTLQYFDHVLSKVKAGLTIYGGFTGHQMTNLIGSTYFNWIAGVNKPARYEQAIKVLAAQKGRYGDVAALTKLSGPKALEQAVARSLVQADAGLELPAAGNKVIVTMQNGTKVTADMIYTGLFREGVLPSAKILEDVESGVTTILDKVKPLGGRGQRAVHAVSEVREHIPRIALGIDRIAKSKGSFADAIEEAAGAIRKWHPDGTGFTNFEKRVMKRIFPFYSWTRKAIPLAIESAIFAGPKVMAYPRLMEAIGLANGVDPNQSVTDPFPHDQMFPDWLRARGIGPIAGGPGSYTVVNPSTPILDVLSQIGQPGQTSIDMLNPLVKVPIETAQSQTLGSASQPLTTNQQWVDYFTKQIPVVSQAGRVSGQIGVSNSTRQEGFPNITNLINMITGAKMVDTGKYQKSAQFDLRDYFRQKAQQQFR